MCVFVLLIYVFRVVAFNHTRAKPTLSLANLQKMNNGIFYLVLEGGISLITDVHLVTSSIALNKQTDCFGLEYMCVVLQN